MSFKSGFVNIVGNPNVGKSTLMNAMVGENLSIITPKSQTTRHRILGVLTGEHFQMVFSDTPGVLKPGYKLQEYMMKFVRSAIGDADIILYVTDIIEKADKNKEFVEVISKMDIPVIVLINKIDLSNQEKLEQLVLFWNEQLPKAIVMPISAKEKFGLNILQQRLRELLPEGPKYYDNETLTDKTLRFFASEIIREKILLNYEQEIPYSAEVEVNSYKETEGQVSIEAVIYVARDSQKGIIIGKQGKALKKTGTEARLDLENFLQSKVFLHLFVKVDPDWRNNDNKLRRYGYSQE